mmetsp:Transcript_72017/g.227657  ORF Transcript_72017/g.227657 Transcript_72017/m.227657 type:complete len:235 (+) Transcript_72017:440-1144(+)
MPAGTAAGCWPSSTSSGGNFFIWRALPPTTTMLRSNIASSIAMPLTRFSWRAVTVPGAEASTSWTWPPLHSTSATGVLADTESPTLTRYLTNVQSGGTSVTELSAATGSDGNRPMTAKLPSSTVSMDIPVSRSSWMAVTGPDLLAVRVVTWACLSCTSAMGSPFMTMSSFFTCHFLKISPAGAIVLASPRPTGSAAIVSCEMTAIVLSSNRWLRRSPFFRPAWMALTCPLTGAR